MSLASGSSWRAGVIPEASGDGLKVGDIIFALFPAHRPGGHEQEGTRPAVVVRLPEGLARESQRPACSLASRNSS